VKVFCGLIDVYASKRAREGRNKNQGGKENVEENYKILDRCGGGGDAQCALVRADRKLED
jgi:hypothetical protein